MGTGSGAFRSFTARRPRDAATAQDCNSSGGYRSLGLRAVAGWRLDTILGAGQDSAEPVPAAAGGTSAIGPRGSPSHPSDWRSSTPRPHGSSQLPHGHTSRSAKWNRRSLGLHARGSFLGSPASSPPPARRWPGAHAPTILHVVNADSPPPVGVQATPLPSKLGVIGQAYWSASHPLTLDFDEATPRHCGLRFPRSLALALEHDFDPVPDLRSAIPLGTGCATIVPCSGGEGFSQGPSRLLSRGAASVLKRPPSVDSAWSTKPQTRTPG